MVRLVDALNACSRPSVDDNAAPFTLAGFKRDIRERQVWCSSCMLAFEGAEPIGVLIGAKRPTETLIDRIAVRPDRQRRGHGRHMLDSLGAKLAILGPPRMVAEIPETLPGAMALFAACGFAREATLTDWVLEEGALSAPVSPAAGVTYLVPTTVADLEANGLIPETPGCAWDRGIATLRARATSLQGVALATVDRIDAFALYRPAAGGGQGATIDVIGPIAGAGANAAHLLSAILARTGPPLILPRLEVVGIAPEWLRACGFRPAATWGRFTAIGRPA